MERKYWNDKSIKVEAVECVDGEYGLFTVLWKDSNGTFYCSTEEGTNNVMRLSAVTHDEAVEECKEYIRAVVKGWIE